LDVPHEHARIRHYDATGLHLLDLDVAPGNSGTDNRSAELSGRPSVNDLDVTVNRPARHVHNRSFVTLNVSAYGAGDHEQVGVFQRLDVSVNSGVANGAGFAGLNRYVLERACECLAAALQALSIANDVRATGCSGAVRIACQKCNR